jgi:hypothetical protein
MQYSIPQLAIAPSVLPFDLDALFPYEIGLSAGISQLRGLSRCSDSRICYPCS